MRFVGSALAAMLLIVASIMPVAAGHGQVSAEVAVWRGDTLVDGPYTGSTECSAVECTVELTANNRQTYSRFVRWCNGDSVTLGFRPGQTVASSSCAGGGPWLIRFSANLSGEHDGHVGVTIAINPPD